jgi:hypothetical protein
MSMGKLDHFMNLHYFIHYTNMVELSKEYFLIGLTTAADLINIFGEVLHTLFCKRDLFITADI